MISFSDLRDESLDSLTEELCGLLALRDTEELSDILLSFLGMTEEDPDIGVALTASSGCLLVRIFDYGRYVFVYPIPLSDGADPSLAIDEIAAYARREELPLVFSDVPREELSVFFGKYRHMNIDSEDAESESYRVGVRSECELLDTMPEIMGERISLGEPTEDDIFEIARLARDGEVNRYWGYSYLDDVGDVPDSYFFENAMRSFGAGVAMPMAIRYEGIYVGEAEYYSFDLSGGAEIAIRLLPEWQGRGLGKETLSLAIRLARRIGLLRLYATVMAENLPSIKFTSSLMTEYKRDEKTVYFVKEL